jgi:hypothetical protein
MGALKMRQFDLTARVDQGEIRASTPSGKTAADFVIRNLLNRPAQ